MVAREIFILTLFHVCSGQNTSLNQSNSCGEMVCEARTRKRKRGGNSLLPNSRADLVQRRIICAEMRRLISTIAERSKEKAGNMLKRSQNHYSTIKRAPTKYTCICIHT